MAVLLYKWEFKNTEVEFLNVSVKIWSSGLPDIGARKSWDFLILTVSASTGLCSPFIHSIVFNDSVIGQWRPWSDCANAQADLGLRCLPTPEYMFLLGTAQMKEFAPRGSRGSKLLPIRVIHFEKGGKFFWLCIHSSKGESIHQKILLPFSQADNSSWKKLSSLDLESFQNWELHLTQTGVDWMNSPTL